MCAANPQIVETWYFQWTVFVLIIASCVFMGFEDPKWDSKPSWYYDIELFFMVMFALEIACKMLVFGVALGDDAYLQVSIRKS